MTEMQRLLERIRATDDCRVESPSGQPVLRDGDCLPDDLATFYALAGGVRLFERGSYPVRVVGADVLVRANPEIVGEDCADDISDAWYIVARGGQEEAITIDCSPGRRGRCYDSFWDCHGVAGACRVVARSFTELLARLLDSGGRHWYWLAGDRPDYGDAYDG